VKQNQKIKILRIIYADSRLWGISWMQMRKKQIGIIVLTNGKYVPTPETYFLLNDESRLD